MIQPLAHRQRTLETGIVSSDTRLSQGQERTSERHRFQAPAPVGPIVQRSAVHTRLARPAGCPRPFIYFFFFSLPSACWLVKERVSTLTDDRRDTLIIALK